MSGGVKNLRAMFEQKHGDSPPERGRSPGTPEPAQSPRPLSKVRTNFVAVEKDGRIGLRRDPSGDSVSVSSRRLSNDTDSTTPAPSEKMEVKEVVVDNAAKNASAFKTNLSQEPIPESPKLDTPVKASASPPKKPQTPIIAPNANPDKVTDEEETDTKLTVADPKVAQPVAQPVAQTNGSATKLNNGDSTVKEKAKTPVNTSKPAPKTTPISTNTKTTFKPMKSPSINKPPLMKRPSHEKAAAKPTNGAAEKKAAVTTHKDDSAKKPAVTKSSVPSSKKAPALELPSSGTGFVKPKPKSPTRPVKLPDSLTRPTASSASRLGVSGTTGGAPARQTVSRNSTRPTSRASVATTTTTKGLKRQNSTINRPRPSLGPPPKPMARDHPVAKKEGQVGHVDESFLARMTRPTQASSGKTSEKAPVTPPRKQSTPKKTAVKEENGNVIKKTVPKSSPIPIKRAVNQKPKDSTERTIKKVDKKPISTEPISTAAEVAPVVAQTETAEEAIEIAQSSADTSVTAVEVKPEEQAATAEPTPAASEAASETAEEPKQVETEVKVEVPEVVEVAAPAPEAEVEKTIEESRPADEEAKVEEVTA